ncbi:hypothetical protein [Bremerella sp. P1]|uniref:hypothetical protein n=1 Tax=Bremerella sp. P1 TaxID=3026424 RepID=UPI002367A915|nr:hypothetical protein [Bremerella sp. P1]WDI43372.1 hypothetical protein PSR63_05360 [Bremerella sp. P1]
MDISDFDFSDGLAAFLQEIPATDLILLPSDSDGTLPVLGFNYSQSDFDLVRRLRESRLPVSTLSNEASVAPLNFAPSIQAMIEAGGWIAPTLFFSAAATSENQHIVSVSLGVIANWLTEIVTPTSSDVTPQNENVRISIILESRKTKTTEEGNRRIDYEGSIEGLNQLAQQIQSLLDNERKA